jgi:osmotically-inducible protein OsmY
MDTAARAVLDQARRALRSEPRLDLHRTPVALAFADGVMTVEGEVDSIAAKKLALERIAALPEVAGIVDWLRVRPAQAMGDGQIRDSVRNALLADPAFAGLTIREVVKGKELAVHEPAAGANGVIAVRVEQGVVTLAGEVPSVALKSLAGVVAWWVPGSRDVVNGLGVEPPEENNDAEITEAVRVALEKDPFVDAAQVRVATSDHAVTLDGLLPTDAEREMAEFDAWYVFGVDRVINRIAVHR